MKVKAGTLVKLLLGLLLLGALLVMADFDAIGEMVGRMAGIPAVAGMLVFAMTGALDMWRLRLASPSARQVATGAFVRMHFESYIMAQLLPGHMGMDAYRVAMIGKNRQRYVEPAVVLFSLRVFSLLVMLAMVAVLLLFLPEWQALYLPYVEMVSALPGWLLSAGLVGLLLCAVLGFRLLRPVLHRFRHRLDDVVEACNALTARLVAQLVLVSLAIIGTRILTFLLTLAAFGVEIGVLQATSVALIASLSWLLPISPAGIGVREGVITGLLVWLGISFEAALMVALLNRVYFIVLALCGGISLMLPKAGDRTASGGGRS